MLPVPPAPLQTAEESGQPCIRSELQLYLSDTHCMVLPKFKNPAAMSSVYNNTRAVSSFKTKLSPSVRKVLIEFWGNDEIVDQPEIIAELGADGVSRINRIGKKSLAEIAQALEFFSYIESSRLWLNKEK